MSCKPRDFEVTLGSTCLVSRNDILCRLGMNTSLFRATGVAPCFDGDEMNTQVVWAPVYANFGVLLHGRSAFSRDVFLNFSSKAGEPAHV